MTKQDLEKTYWIWYFGENDNVLGFNLFTKYEDLEQFSHLHAKENKDNPNYWSNNDKVGKHDAEMKIIRLK